jgi:hypothetical protein
MDTSDARTHLEATLTSFDAGLTTLSPAAGRGIIERWLNVLKDHPELNDVATTLGELRAALLDQPIDGVEVGRLLEQLGARTTQAARSADDDTVMGHLERLGALLSTGGKALSTSAPRESRDELNATGESVQQPSSPHAQNPQNAGRKAQVGDVQSGAASGTPGRQYNPD